MTTSGRGGPRCPCAPRRAPCGPGSSGGTGTAPPAWTGSSPTAATSPRRSGASGTERRGWCTRRWISSASALRRSRARAGEGTSSGWARSLRTSGSTSPWRRSARWTRRCGWWARGRRPRAHLRPAAARTSAFWATVSDAEVAALYRDARALLFTGEEDFGSTPLEAQATGRPVIAYAQGGVLETVTPRTGLFFSEQTPAALAAAVRQFDAWEASFRPEEARAQAEASPRPPSSAESWPRWRRCSARLSPLAPVSPDTRHNSLRSGSLWACLCSPQALRRAP